MMNNPFDYEPSAEMLEAQKQLIAHIESLCRANRAFKEEVGRGKMFGILIVNGTPSLIPPKWRTIIPTDGKVQPLPLGRASGVLYAFSGQICGTFSIPGFVPPVFDYLDEDGYFKVHEREITAMNHQIAEMESSSELASLRNEYARLKSESEKDIEEYRMQMKAAKMERDLMRAKGLADEASLILESQFMKAELHRKKLHWKGRLEELSVGINGFVGTLNLLKLQRQQKSDALQRWLFEQFVFTSPHTLEKKNLLEIFVKYYLEHSLNSLPGRVGDGHLPPSGSGECCEPKLLHYALEHDIAPVEIGMFWWGDSPKQEVRHHLQFYPACNGKCKPILEYLLSDAPSITPPRERISQHLHQGGDGQGARSGEGLTLSVLYEDNFIIVVNKPSGMMSVPGRSDRQSVFSILKARYPECKELQMVHRLDMDTSGLLVVAKTKEAHKCLQRQFAEHTIKKEYVAVLAKPLKQAKGIISLPLRPDYDDRPRQMVDKINGKEAVTQYHNLAKYLPFGGVGEGALVCLSPLTGRTHQLRVHCAHREGLDNPIRGDRLYGQKADRLYLHAEYIEFTHPTTEERMKFRLPPDWNTDNND